MATLLLTAVGSAIGGPIGAAIGAMAGQRVDQALFGPKGRQGARLADLSVQSSSYGSSIPRICGRMRVSGTVIWATDLREERRRVSQGKGSPKATVYSYSASFAVLLSARPASRIGRIWADGKLLRGAAGDFKVETGFRFYSGEADQNVDPLIASAEGASAPAYRDRAYAVFEDMALESFGNRIPMLSFEVIAEEGGITPVDLFRDLAGDMVSAAPSTMRFEGYVADGASVRAALAPLDALQPIEVRDNGLLIEIGTLPGAPIVVATAAAGASATATALPLLEQARTSAVALPSRAELSFADTARDYQSGLQSIDLHLQGRVLHIDLPASLHAEDARKLIANCLFCGRTHGLSAELRLPWHALATWQASAVAFDGVIWRVRGLRFEAMCLILQLAPSGLDAQAALPADAGRPTSELDQTAGETVLLLADLPPLGDTAPAAPLVVVAAAGRGAGWRSATLLMRSDGRPDWQEIGGTAAPAIIGDCVDVLASGSTNLFDLTNSLTVRLLHEGMGLLNVRDSALHEGANVALVGEEVLQFGSAERIGENTWKLSRLLRGRRGTESAAAGHLPGERFLLLDADTLLPMPVAPGNLAVEVLANGVGDPIDVQARCDIDGRALRPLSPVHLSWNALEDGSICLKWVRRSREGWRWLDTVDAPLGEETELYRIELAGSPATTMLTATGPMVTLSSAMVNSFKSQGRLRLDVAIVQTGRFATSRPLTGQIPL